MTRPIERKAPGAIASMFNAIAPRYDFLNHVLSCGLDRTWRARAVSALALRGGETVLDLCAGTADLAIAALRPGPAAAARVVGVDFAEGMLRIGQRKLARLGLASRVPLVRGDALRVPLCAGSVDAAMIAFGIRNVEDPAAACRELYRVLKPGGRVALLEFGIPRTRVLGRLYLWYFQRVLPPIGRLVSGHRDAYSYLPASVHRFAPADACVRLLADVGFVEPTADRLTGGVVYLYSAAKA